MKNIFKSGLLLVLIALLSVILTGCGSGGGGGGGEAGAGAVSVDEYAGHYNGTIRYELNGVQPFVLTIEFDVNQQGDLASFIVDGVAIDIAEVNSTITAGSSIEINGVIKGQGSFNDTTFGPITFTFNGVFDKDSGQCNIIYTYTGGLNGTAELIVNKT